MMAGMTKGLRSSESLSLISSLMKRKAPVVDGNGFLRYHNNKRSKKEVERPPECGKFIEVMLPEIRAALYRLAPLQTTGRLARTCQALALELMEPKKGWLWLPTKWRSELSARLPCSQRLVQYQQFLASVPVRVYVMISRGSINLGVAVIFVDLDPVTFLSGGRSRRFLTASIRWPFRPLAGSGACLRQCQVPQQSPI